MSLMRRTGLAGALLMAAVSAFAAPPLAVIQRVHIGGPGGWDYPAFDAQQHILYMSHGDAIASFNVVTGAVNPALARAHGAHVALPVHGGSVLLITNGKADNVTLNDPQSGEVQATIATDPGPDAAVEDPGSGHVFVMANHAGRVDVVDLAARGVLARIDVQGRPEAAAADGHGLVFTHLEDKNSIAVIDAHSFAVRTRIALSDCEEPSGIAYVPEHNWILSACQNGVARFTDAASGAEVAKLPIGAHPDFALVDTRRRLAYVPCGDGTFTVITLAGAHPAVSAVVSTEDGARTAALDESSGRIYLPVADLGKAAAPGEHRPVVADTFRVLVLGR